MASGEDTSIDEPPYYVYLRQGVVDAWNSFDKTILTLAGGALGLSVTFAEKVVGASPVATSLLLVGWISLVMSLVFVSGSFFTAARTFHNAVVENKKRAGAWDRATLVLNSGSLAALAVGLGGLAVFAYQNV